MGQPAIPDSCYNCKHFQGIYLIPNEDGVDRGTEQQATVNCNAYPTGIPDAIQDGTDMHREPIRGDNGIQFELAEV